MKKNVKIGSVIGIDLQEVEVLPGAKFYQLDFMANDADLEVKKILEDGEVIFKETQVGFDSETGKPVMEKKALDLSIFANPRNAAAGSLRWR